MCFDYDSEPPIPALAGAAVDHEDLVLESADGTELAAFMAVPAEPGSTGVVILPDIRGLYRFYEELALRFAERGCPAIAYDYFGRTAGAAKRDEDFDYGPHVAQTTAEGVLADAQAAAERLRADGATRIVTVGFCFGGRYAWLTASELDGIDGAVGFYGRPGEAPGRGPSPVARAGALKAPIVALMGGADPGIPVEEVRAYEAALQAAGADAEVVVYDDAPHSFFDRKHEEFAEASADAWERTLSFVAARGA